MQQPRRLLVPIILVALLSAAGGLASAAPAESRAGSFAPAAALAGPAAPSLGSAQSFAVLAGSTATNTGDTIVRGDLGVSPGSAVTGFPPGLVTGGTIHSADAVAAQAQNDLTSAYTDLAGRPCNTVLTGQDLGGLTLTPGVYCFSTSAQLTGALVLDAQGDSSAVFIFQIGSTLTTASNSSVRMINSGRECNVYWQVGSSATLGTGTSFAGNILALQSITLNTGASMLGRALARNGAVTMDTNDIGCGRAPTATPTDTAAAATATASSTFTPTAGPTATPSASSTATATANPTTTATQGPSATSTVGPSATGTASSTPTPDVSPTQTAQATATPTSGVSPTLTAEATPTPTSGASPTLTAEATPTPTSGASPTQTAQATPTPTSGVSPTQTEAAGPTPTSGPTTAPTSAPTTAPTSAPTVAPTSAPTAAPISAPVTAPSPTATPEPAVAGVPSTGGGAPLGQGTWNLLPSLVMQAFAQRAMWDPLTGPVLDLRAGPVGMSLELWIPSLQLTAPVIGVGITSGNVMDAPWGPADDPVWQKAFWYRGSGIPGGSGTATIAGHVVDILGRPAVFGRLTDLQSGDSIIVRDTRSGLVDRFIVTEVESYSVQEAADPSILAQIYGAGPVSGRQPEPAPDGLSHLTLITCSGDYVLGSYDHRLVVYAQREPTGAMGARRLAEKQGDSSPND